MPILETVFTKRHRISERRLAICEECPSYVPSTSVCKECGCFMKAKALLPFVECPLGKWGKQ